MAVLSASMGGGVEAVSIGGGDLMLFVTPPRMRGFIFEGVLAAGRCLLLRTKLLCNLSLNRLSKDRFGFGI
jgi:hypothetical protein